ncbi:MAG: hypothetical protein AAFU67_15215 [Bacteroidota bacterium]
MEKIRETIVHLLDPVTESQNVYVIGHSVSFNNTGDDTVIVDHVKRIPPGSTWTIAHPNFNLLLVQNFHVRFEGTGADPYLEVELQQLKGGKYSSYVKQQQ